MVENKKEYLFNILIFLPYLSFFLGFYLDENSAGAGAGDLYHIWKNLQIFIKLEFSGMAACFS